jgi:glycerophosphoryl diester phosphodiesterase
MVSILGHRGAAGLARENTIAAFVEAKRLGADGVELDVRRTADGALVVHHDPEIPSFGAVSELKLSELPPYVPLLHAALEACDGLVVNVEIKNLPTEPGFDADGGIATSVAGLVMEQRLAAGVVISCFHLATIDSVKSAEPAIPTGWLTVPRYDQGAALATAAERGHDALHPHHEGVTAELVAEAHQRGLAIATWTVDEPERLRQVADMGVDTVITNDVAGAIATLRPPSAD